MRPIKLYLHIGTAKTGTTSIQELFHENRAFLQSQGYFYLSSEGAKHHRHLACYGMPSGQTDEFLRALQVTTPEERQQFDQEIEKNLTRDLACLPKHIHSVVCSSEHFHSRCTNQKGIERLARLLRRHFAEIAVIVYLRPQIDVALSLYSTALKAGSTQDLETFLRKHCHPNNYYYDYACLLTHWANAFGPENIRPRRFDKQTFRRGDLLDDILATCGIAQQWQEKVITRPRQMNESLNSFGQLMLRQCNRVIPRFNPDNTWSSLAGRIHARIGAQSTGLAGIETSRAIALQAQFDEINAQVCRRWFPERDTLFTLEWEKYRPAETSFGEQERKTVAALFKLLGEEIERPQRDARILKQAAEALRGLNLPLAQKMADLASPQSQENNRQLSTTSKHQQKQ